MARTNAYLQAGNGNRDVSVGGRGTSDHVWAWLNTDNGGGSDCGIRVNAEVVGERSQGGRPRKTCHACDYKWVEAVYNRDTREYDSHGDDALTECPKCGAPRQGLDTRKSVFTVELPEQSGEHCEVHIRKHNARLEDLARFGAALVGMQAAECMANGDYETAEQKLSAVSDVLADMESKLEELPTVYLPGGITLKHALACVEVVRRLRTDTPEN